MLKPWFGKMLMASCFVLAGNVFGAGFQLYTEGSAEALGTGGAVSGRTNLVSQAWYNPAALAGTESRRMMAGMTLANPQVRCSPVSAGAPDEKTESHWRAIPHFYYAGPLAGKMTGTFSVGYPYGLATEWKDSWSGKLPATKTELLTLYLTPSLVYAVNDRFALSAGFNAVWSEAEMSSYRPDPLNGAGLFKRTMRAGGAGWGYTGSMYWQLTDDWGFGARYQSGVRLNLEGDLTVGGLKVSNGSSDVDLPASVNLGVANTSFERWTFSADAVWTEWSAYDKLALQFDEPVFNLSSLTYTTSETVAKNWANVWSFRFGAEYALSEQWVLRGGYVRDESPIPGDTRGPDLPGSDRHMFMAGTGYRNGRLGIDLGYSYLLAKDCDFAPKYAAAGVEGDLETDAHLIALSVSYDF